MATPELFKRLGRTSLVRWTISAVGATYLNSTAWTARIDRPQPPAGGPFLLAMWHGRLLLLDYLRPTGRALVTLISGHRDGQIISTIASIGSFGKIRTVSGSSSRGGSQAMRQLIRYARAGETIFITPDGPRGPNMQAQRGVIEIARLTGLPILPASVSASRARRLRSWDRMLVPFHFTRIAVRWGEPIRIERDSDTSLKLAQLEAALNACQQSADAACGRADDPEIS
jgi:lysophospholipid acyltransferase (LPLAT)-like uncharacterized protein